MVFLDTESGEGQYKSLYHDLNDKCSSTSASLEGDARILQDRDRGINKCFEWDRVALYIRSFTGLPNGVTPAGRREWTGQPKSSFKIFKLLLLLASDPVPKEP
jgi:hypothetical protein